MGSNPARDTYFHFEFFNPILFRTAQWISCKWNQAWPFTCSHSCFRPQIQLIIQGLVYKYPQYSFKENKDIKRTDDNHHSCLRSTNETILYSQWSEALLKLREIFHLRCYGEIGNIHKCSLKASAHSFKRFTSWFWKWSFSLSMHLYTSDWCHAWFHLYGASQPARSASKAPPPPSKNTKWKILVHNGTRTDSPQISSRMLYRLS